MRMIIDCFDLIDFDQQLGIGWCLRLDVDCNDEKE
jgi:hypothetical protein